MYDKEIVNPQKIAAMYKSGLTPRKIAKQIKVPGVASISLTTIKNKVIEGGEKLRKRGGSNPRDRVKAKEYYDKITSVKGYETMTRAELLAASGVNRWAWDYCRGTYKFEYKKQNRPGFGVNYGGKISRLKQKLRLGSELGT